RVLIGGVERDIRVVIGVGHRHIGLHLHIHAEGAHGEVVLAPRAPGELVGRAPIGGRAVDVDVVIGVEAHIAEPAVREALVGARLEIHVIVDHGVRGRTGNHAPESADDRSGADPGHERGADVGIGPGRRGVPQILYGGIVIHGDAYDRVGAEELQRPRVTNVGVVPAEMPVFATVGGLRKHADVLGETRRQAYRDL